MSSRTMCPRCRKTGTGVSSTTGRRSRPAMFSSSPRWCGTWPSARWKRASPPVRSRCTRGRRKSSPRSSCTRSTRTRRARRNTSTGCWRSASPPPPERVTAVIAAAGSGERLGAGGPKAFVPVAGRPMVEWSIAGFQAAGVAAIVVAAPPGEDSPALLDVSDSQGTAGGADLTAGADLTGGGADLKVVPGGETRSQSVSNALEVVESEVVAIHDAARPLVTPNLIEDVVATLLSDPDAAGAIAAAPLTDTIKQSAGGRESSSTASESARDSKASEPARTALTVHDNVNAVFVVENTLDRERLWAAQTPQVFRVGPLRAAVEADGEATAAATDEAMLVEAAGGRVLICPAPPENLKVTTPLDLKIAEELLR